MSKKYMTIFCDNISMINNRPSLEGIYIGGKMGISGQLPGDLDRLSIITLAPDLDKAYPNIDVSEDILTTVEFPDGRVINGRYHSPTDGSIPEMIGFDLSPFTITSTGDVKVYLHIKDEEPVLTGILKIIQNPD